MRLADAVEARPHADGGGPAVVCAVGAGGKKSLLYSLADRIPRSVVTATVRIPIFDDHVAAVEVTPDPATAVRDADAFPLGVVPEREREDRYRGYDPDELAPLADADVDAVLVKADGARTRRLKAPNEREPQIPDCADVVVPIASARVVGEPLTEDAVHRPERVADLTGLDVGDTIGPRDVATVLAHSEGGLKDVPAGAAAIPLVNMADDRCLLETAVEIGECVHEQAVVPRVVVTSLKRDDPVREVVR